MEKFYSLFIANEELYTSPLVYQYAKKHHHSLSLGVPEVLVFELNTYLITARYSEICLVYNTNMLEINAAEITEKPGRFITKTIVTINVTPREIGSTTLGVTTPVLAENYSLKVFHPWYATT